MNTQQLGSIIESFAPLCLQESWDNSGYNVDLHNDNIERILLCLDVTLPVVREAQERGCGAIISHHPLLFRPVKTIDAARFPGSVLAELVKAGISLYCAHTTMDSAACGLNTYVADLLGLVDTKPLSPVDSSMQKIRVTVPTAYAGRVRNALFSAGAGSGTGYSDCSFTSNGMGTFRPLPGANPFIGSVGELESVEECMIEAVVPAAHADAAIQAVQQAHPYEVPAIELHPVRTILPSQDGLGRVGRLEHPMELRAFASRVKDALQAPAVTVTGECSSVCVVAVCTGAGASEIGAARAAGADVFVTGEAKHNEFVEASMPLIAAGHYDTEKWFTEALRAALQQSELAVQYKIDICMSEDMQRPYELI